MTVSLVDRAARTSSTSRSTRLAEARPPWSALAVHASIRLLSSTWVAPMTEMRWPFTSAVKGANASSSSSSAPIQMMKWSDWARDNEALLESVIAVVEEVVVGHAHGIEAGRPQGVDGRWRRPEGELLVGTGAAHGDRGLGFPMARSAPRRMSSKGPRAVVGSASSRARLVPSKCMSPTKAIVMACPTAEAVDGGRGRRVVGLGGVGRGGRRGLGIPCGGALGIVVRPRGEVADDQTDRANRPRISSVRRRRAGLGRSAR